MNKHFQQGELFEKYRHSLSKRYKGYNRVIQLNINHSPKQSRSILEVQQQDNPNKQFASSNSIQMPKHSLSQNRNLHQKILFQNNNTHSKSPNFIVIQTTNPQLNLQQISTQTEINKRKFMKTKFLKHSSVHSQQLKQKQSKKSQNTQRILQNTVQQFLDNKFKFKKRFIKDSAKFGIPQQNQIIFRNQLLMRLEPFSPIIRGQKKNAYVPQTKNKKSKTQYQAGINEDQNNRQKRNLTETRKQHQQIQSENFKRTNSFIARKSGTQTVIEKFSIGVQPQKLLKKLSSNLQYKSSLQHNNTIQKLSFPKINCAKKESIKNNQIPFNPILELQKKSQKYKKTPLLLRYKMQLKNIDSESYIVCEADSEFIIYGHRFNTPYQIASLTKIMTFYVVYKLVEQFKIDIKQQKVQIDSKCTNVGGTSADLYAGQIYTLESLLYGLMLPSGNDAALSLAVWGGKFDSANPQDPQTCIANFVTLMNKQAKNLNLTETRFGNPHGLPHKYGRSTAFDIAKLCMNCMKIELFKKIVQTKIYKCVVNSRQGRKRFNVWQNTNKLLRRQGFVGIKTGITITAGPCLASAYKFRQKTYICVILRALKISRRFKQTRKIIHWCLQTLFKESLSQQQILQLKSLKKNNAQLDSDYSEDESIFRYDVNNSKQFRKRCDIISQM